MNNQQVRLLVSFKVNHYEKFKEVAKQCAQYVAQNEPATLTYEWFVDADQAKGRLFEVYESSEALKEHMQGPVFGEMGPKFEDAITWVSIETFGTMPEVFHQILGGLPMTSWPSPLINVTK
jgi:quinol monooxygenase YgiN